MTKEEFNKLQNGDLIYMQDHIYIFDDKYKIDDETFHLYFLDYNYKDIILVTKDFLKEKHDREIKEYEEHYQKNISIVEKTEERMRGELKK